MIKEFNLKKWNGKQIYIYGAGQDGRVIAQGLRTEGLASIVFIDRRGDKNSSLPIVKMEDIKLADGINIILGSGKYMREIYANIKDKCNGFQVNVFTATEIYLNTVKEAKNHDFKQVYDHYSYVEGVQKIYADINEDAWYIKDLSLIVTEICTLKCEACSSLMPLYKHPQNISLDNIFEAMDNLLHSNCYIGQVSLLGGEPLINQEALIGIMKRYGTIKNIGAFKVITNGTLMPAPELLNVMKATGKGYFVFSNYGDLSCKREEAVKCIESYDIEAGIVQDEDISLENSTVWIDFGIVKHYGHSSNFTKNMFDDCLSKDCTTLLNGKLCVCPRIAHAINLGKISDVLPGNYISLLNNDIENIGFDALRKKCAQLFNPSGYPSGCAFCNRGKLNLVERAKQMQ